MRYRFLFILFTFPDNLPVIDMLNIKDKDELGVIKGYESGFPVLYIFFKNGKFTMAAVSADNRSIHLQASTTVNAIVGLMASFSYWVPAGTRVCCVLFGICILGSSKFP